VLSFFEVPPPENEVTVLLNAWTRGDAGALDRLSGLVYEELRRIARRYMRGERAGNTLQTTALVNEVYLRLARASDLSLEGRGQFFGLCATMMRRVLVDAARARGARKRDGGERVVLDEAVPAMEPGVEILTLNSALEEFAAMAPRQAKVVELRYFGGLDEQQIAAMMNVSTRTVERDWTFARSWLMQQLAR
jgi:RNA polymerase sigma factor (TIGR02999 family)